LKKESHTMTLTQKFIRHLELLKEGDRSKLRAAAGAQLGSSLEAFDIFTGIWWPLRNLSPRAPRREVSWLVAKLFASFAIPHVRSTQAEVGPTLPHLLAKSELLVRGDRSRYRGRVDALLQSPLSRLESPLRWALAVVAAAVQDKHAPGLDWARLLDDLSIWDRGPAHSRERDIRHVWAEIYLNAVNNSRGG
jgi:hypothetical protein